MESPETQPDQAEDRTSSDEEVQEFVEEIENDPAHNPDDPDLEIVKGG